MANLSATGGSGIAAALWPTPGITAVGAVGESAGLLALVKVLAALTLVLAAIFFVAWLFKRLAPASQVGSLMRVLGSVSIGPRERLVLVEIDQTWFVLAVATGGISTVHTMPRQTALLGAPREQVSGWLRTLLVKRVS